MASSYRVVYPEVIRTETRTFLDKAIQKGRGEEALSALETIDQQLRIDPFRFGDPWFSLSQMNVQVMTRIYGPWRVVYGVHRAKPVVFIRSISPFPEDAFE